MLPCIPQDPPWEHILPVEHPDLASRHNVEKGTRLQSEIEDIDHAFSDSASPEATMDQQKSQKWEQLKGYDNTYSTGAHDRYHSKCDRSNSLQGLHFSNDTNTDTSYTLTLGGGPASHSSPDEMTESSSTMEPNFPETVRSNSPQSDNPDSGPSDRGGSSSGQGLMGNRPRPFSRKSKAGIEHTVTPARAGPDGGFICRFQERGKVCGQSFKLPSDIRFHLIENHMTFSPFQCDRCKRVYTRKSLYTRHLKEVPQDNSTSRRTRQCPHRLVEQDESYRIRKTTYEALWAIQLSQEQVDNAANIISQYNGKLPGRRRRTQSTTEHEIPTAVSADASQSASHSSRQSESGFPTHQNPPYVSQPEPVYPPHIMRVSSAPNLYAQNTIADSAGSRRPSPMPCFSTGPSASYEAISPFHGQQDPNALSTGTTSYDRQYLNPGDALYSSQPRGSEFYEAPRGFSTSSDSIAPHMIQSRQTSWDDPGVESSYETTTWSSGNRAGYREPMAFESTGQASSYQFSTAPNSDQVHHTAFSQELSPRRCDYQNAHRDNSPKRRG
ncbi:uncharacterized protein LAJ45_00090 [Morchella importuna]|uniref:uncharacterized protein n=1 Tax=Morchella importuna TaxID=1174673 RepID=UPI001E8D3186|nr:uncharacterized protein LAJ45_00090 [Morchella importuna]KAH8155081.1 hypothetical protein LAJ45_00090 [Morchella importuna]